MFENAEEDAKLAIINNYFQQIKDVDFAKTPLTIFFRKGTPSFKSYQQTLKEKLDSYEHISELYIQYKYYDTFGQSLITKSKSLASKEGLDFAYQLVTGYYLNEDINVNSNEFKPIYSDTNEDANKIPITINRLTELRICHKNELKKPFGNNGVKIYADNGGTFLKYKINDNYSSSEFLCKKLLRYQITNDLKSNADIFKMNCLVYALLASDKFDNTTIESMMCK